MTNNGSLKSLTFVITPSYHIVITMMDHETYLSEARCSFATFLVIVAENNFVLGERMKFGRYTNLKFDKYSIELKLL